MKLSLDRKRWFRVVNGISHAALTIQTYCNVQDIMKARGLAISEANLQYLKDLKYLMMFPVLHQI